MMSSIIRDVPFRMVRWFLHWLPKVCFFAVVKFLEIFMSTGGVFRRKEILLRVKWNVPCVAENSNFHFEIFAAMSRYLWRLLISLKSMKFLIHH